MKGNSTAVLPFEYRISLVVLYVLVLIGGIIGAIIMSISRMSNMRSVSKVAVINLLVVHVIFLCTVPFRIYYYLSNRWELSFTFCKLVSGMLHVHLYLSFIFYAIILCTRFLAHFKWRHRLEFYRTLHAVIASGTIWAIIVAIIIPSTFKYGADVNTTDKQCFSFGTALRDRNIKMLNYIICAVVLLIWVLLASCQTYIFWHVCRTHRELRQRQEFWAQIKSMCFVVIMLVCFVPYQGFRIFYVCTYWTELEKVNEVFLALTSFSCFDMIVFAGSGMLRSAFSMCLSS